jgi:GT2 family glycosyltransferase
VVVDNASADGSAQAVRRVTTRARVVEAGANLGFAAGCLRGARETSAPLLLFLNPDAVPAPGCVDALRAAATQQPGWGAWQALVTQHGDAQVNSAGNPVHFLGFAWAGGHGEPIGALDGRPREIASASGAALVVRREAWRAVGGFDERYFMYGEDVDLSLRLRLAGWDVGVVPLARVTHDYAFAKGAYKWFYLERNRWWTVLGTYPARLLLLLAPALAAFELALLVAAWRGRWLAAKLRAVRAVLGAVPALLERRRSIQSGRRVADAAFAAALTDSLDSPYLPTLPPALARLQRAYWRGVRALLR